MELDSVDKHIEAFYRLVGTTSEDSALTEQGEATNEVAYLYLTRGCRKAQRWMINVGYDGWRKRSSALSWSGTDAADGGRYTDLPDDFLRAYGNERKSALCEAGGDGWGQEIDPEQEHLRGNFYYVNGPQLWITRNASPPSTLYLKYHYTHPKWESSTTIEFPMDARSLIVAQAANAAKEENWLPGGPEMKAGIVSALAMAREEARDIVRPTKKPRQMRKAPRCGNRW